ncbi:MAG TPA: enoyl-CoA hydratase-related protein [Vicinamibacteria bacterium]|nr:enoyl-CoA hydratase-related protein [Vicinamibacteria bacterium]
MPDDENLKISQYGNVAVVAVNRPKKLNAMNGATLDELEDSFDRLGGDDATRAVIVTGVGDKAFVAGADIGELAKLGPTSGREASRRGQTVFGKVERLGKPVVAAINGFALGGGLELALACHLRVAVSTAKLGLPEVKLGAIPGYGGTQRLARLVGRGRALEMILTGEPVGAEEAYRIGLVNRVTSAETLLDDTRDLVGKILQNGPLALEYALVAVGEGLETDQDRGLLLESTLFGILCGSQDLKEGMNAFLEKRRAGFTGK